MVSSIEQDESKDIEVENQSSGFEYPQSAIDSCREYTGRQVKKILEGHGVSSREELLEKLASEDISMEELHQTEGQLTKIKSQEKYLPGYFYPTYYNVKEVGEDTVYEKSLTGPDVHDARSFQVTSDGSIFTGGVDGSLHRWTPQDDGSYEEVFIGKGKSDVCRFQVTPDESIFTGDYNGRLNRWIPQDDGSYKEVFIGKSESTIFHLQVTPDESIFTGDEEGNLIHWIPQDDGSYKEVLIEKSEKSITCLQVMPDGSILTIDSHGSAYRYTPQ